MIIEVNGDVARAEHCADIVIIGAGTLGVYIAALCARLGASVVCVEAGGKIVDTTSNTKTARAIGKPHDGIALGRASGLGGTSVLWGGQLVEFEEGDLARHGNPWPIRYETLSALYQQTYRELGVPAPPGPEQLVGAEAQRSAAGPGDAIEKFYTSWMPEPNVASIYRRELSTRGKVTVLLGATVHSVGFDGSRAAHVEASVQGSLNLRVKGRAFVVACGTIASSRLMLHLGRSEKVPWRGNDNIGCYFQDHLGGRIAAVRLRDERGFRKLFENIFVGGAKLQPKLRWSNGGRATSETGVAGLFAFDSEVGENIANVKMVVRSLRRGIQYSSLARLPKDVWAIGRVFVPIVAHYVRERRIMALFDRGLDLLVQAEQIPLRESRLSLGRDVCEDGMPAVLVDWRIDGLEMKSIRKFALDVQGALSQLGIADLAIDESLLDGDPRFLDTLTDTYHASGGLRMAGSARDGVVDAECRVWGTDNVFVAGSSIFPTSGHANTTFTSLALATQLARRLAIR